MNFRNVRFAGSALQQFPEFRGLPEVAIVGRSNVGKSSLINHLLQQKHLAKVSATPGKTITVNFFLVDDAFLLVDLPGYGYAKRPHETKKTWAACIDAYFKNRTTLKLICLLIDSRRMPSDDDLQFAAWARHFGKPILLIFTKSDTLSADMLEKNRMEALKLLDLPQSLYYSIHDGKSRQIAIDRLCETLWAR